MKEKPEALEGSTLPRHLDPTVKIIWFVPTAIALGAIWIAIVLGLGIFAPADSYFGFSLGAFALLLLSFLALFIGVPVFFYNHIEYMSYTYELSDIEIIIRHGVFTRFTTVIPYARIQNVNTERTILERLLGLATLKIETAGGQADAEGVLPGIAKKDELLREIMESTEKVKKARGGQEGGHNGKSERELLYDILKELVALNNSIRDNFKPRGDAPKHSPNWAMMPPAPTGIEHKKEK